jgi:crotonobetainyl-CoA:carnitine CoA-transferase CaiB-like acyl-CoA transferase
MSKFFSDLKVIELAGVLAGPSVGIFFAELGAKVIKIENPKTGGDVTRSWKSSNEDPADKGSAYYWSVNAGKEILFLDIATEDGLQKLYALIKDADVLITNFKMGDAEKLKLTYAQLSALNPQLIYASINGFGENNPRTAYDLILQAEAGFMLINGEPGSDPVKMPVALIDIIAGHQLKEGILVALLQREKKRKGSHVSVSLFDSAVASLANQATNWLIAGYLPQALGSLHPNIAPYGELFYTKDQHAVTFAIGSDKQFSSLCELLGLKKLISDPKFTTNQNRVKNRNELFMKLKPQVEIINFDELYKKCLGNDVPIGKLRNIREVFELPEGKNMLKAFSINGNTKTIVNPVAFKFIDHV